MGVSQEAGDQDSDVELVDEDEILLDEDRGCDGSRGRGSSTVGSFDPQACYFYRKQGHLARDCMQAGNTSGCKSSNVART